MRTPGTPAAERESKVRREQRRALLRKHNTTDVSLDEALRELAAPVLRNRGWAPRYVPAGCRSPFLVQP